MPEMPEDPSCGATAHLCVCGKRPGHVEAGDDVHECEDRDVCRGRWAGEFDRPGFRPIAFPLGVDVDGILRRLLP